MKSPKLAVGVDIIEINRIKQAILSWQNSFLQRIYTEAELENCKDMASRLAVRFAAKEAVMKALGTGAKDLGWKDIEILSNTNGAPLIQLSGEAKDKAREIGVTEFSISLSHSKHYAIALVIGNAN